MTSSSGALPRSIRRGPRVAPGAGDGMLRMNGAGENLTWSEARITPPITEMLRASLPVGGGTDATRVASYNPWVSLYWLTTGRTVGGLVLYPENNRLDRTKALDLWTKGSAWFSGEEHRKGLIRTGEYADLAVLSACGWSGWRPRMPFSSSRSRENRGTASQRLSENCHFEPEARNLFCISD